MSDVDLNVTEREVREKMAKSPEGEPGDFSRHTLSEFFGVG